MSSLLASCATLLIGLAVGAALQRWGDGERKLHGHKRVVGRHYPEPEFWRGQIAEQWTGW